MIIKNYGFWDRKRDFIKALSIDKLLRMCCCPIQMEARDSRSKKCPSQL
jgi:hypothetical protein